MRAIAGDKVLQYITVEVHSSDAYNGSVPTEIVY